PATRPAPWSAGVELPRRTADPCFLSRLPAPPDFLFERSCDVRLSATTRSRTRPHKVPVKESKAMPQRKRAPRKVELDQACVIRDGDEGDCIYPMGDVTADSGK